MFALPWAPAKAKVPAALDPKKVPMPIMPVTASAIPTTWFRVNLVLVVLLTWGTTAFSVRCTAKSGTRMSVRAAAMASGNQGAISAAKSPTAAGPSTNPSSSTMLS